MSEAKDNTSPFEEILEWSQDKPTWQRDALRRLLVTGELSTKDINELEVVLRQSNDLLSTKSTAIPLALPHIPKRGLTKNNSLTVKRIFDNENVNAIPNNQELRFSASGLSAIYGDNGSGKSGYGRVLKRVCRARMPGNTIKPNLYKNQNEVTTKACIEYEIEGNDYTANWVEGQEVDEVLSNITFFDSDCAEVHVDKENDVAFTPYNIKMITELADASQTLKEKIQTEKSQVKARIRKLNINEKYKGTVAYDYIRTIKSKSDKLLLDRLCTIDEKDTNRQEELAGLLSKDSIAEGKRIASEILTLKGLSTRVGSMAVELSDEVFQSLIQSSKSADDARKAANQAAKGLFKNEPLPNIGEAVWKQLWESARSYSKTVYTDNEFPNISEGSLCVFCQQPLSDEAKRRLTSFESFVKDDSEQKAKVAERQRDGKYEEIGRVQTLLLTEAESQLISELDTTLLSRLNSFIDSLNARKQSVSDGVITVKGDNPKPPDNQSLKQLEILITTLEDKVKELKAVSDPKQRASYVKELMEIEARKELNEIKEDVLSQIDDLVLVGKLDNALKEVNTANITRFIGAITDKYITNTLRDRFMDEVNQLNVQSVRTELVKSTSSYGRQTFKIKLVAAPDANLSEILSEGEFRCLSIAGFLADLATSEHRSGIVLDDPVSSLDHRYRESVAKRLAEESLKRQVVVFTHDIGFLLMLQEYAGQIQTPFYCCHITRFGSPGKVNDDLPWIALSTKKRIGQLKVSLQAARAHFNKQLETEYNHAAGIIYGQLRETWERAIEEVLFNGAIVRFGRAIQTQRLKKVTVLKDDYTAIDKGMSKCSQHMIGHDGSHELNQYMPEPDEILEDINFLENWQKEISKRIQKSK